MTFRNVWEKTLIQLEEMVSKNALEMWINTLEPVAYEDDAAVLISPSKLSCFSSASRMAAMSSS